MIYDTLTKTQLPVAYSHFRDKTKPPYLVYIGAGQDTFAADNTYYDTANFYQVEYYYTVKNEDVEKTIETVLLSDGYVYEKSEDLYLEEEQVFVIYYEVHA